MKGVPGKTSRLPFGTFAVLIAISGLSGAATAAAPPEIPTKQTAEYRQLTTDWACATLRLYLRERSSTSEEAWDWSHGSWRLLEVVRAIQTLPERSRCVSAPVLANLKQHMDIIEARAARVEESYRVFWLMDVLGQSEQESTSSLHPPLLSETVGKMRAAGWGDEAILKAVSDPTSREARIFRASLITRVHQWDQQRSFPYRDPELPYLPAPNSEQVDALRRAASSVTEASH